MSLRNPCSSINGSDYFLIKARSIIDSDMGLIESAEIDKASDIIIDTFNQFFELDDEVEDSHISSGEDLYFVELKGKDLIGAVEQLTQIIESTKVPTTNCICRKRLTRLRH